MKCNLCLWDILPNDQIVFIGDGKLLENGDIRLIEKTDFVHRICFEENDFKFRRDK